MIIRDQRSEIRDQRVYYFDFLRVVGVLAVIAIHSCGGIFSIDINTFEWNVTSFYNASVRWAVPVFVMISGALFLGRDIPLRRLYGKNILRIFTALFFWSFVYALYGYMKAGKLRGAIEAFVYGRYHLWFLYMLIGLYIIVPVMKKIAESEFASKYFLALSLIFAFIIPQGIISIRLIRIGFSNGVESFINRFSIKLVSGYVGYFLLGYFLNNIDISHKTTRKIYIAGILGFCGAVLMSTAASLIINKAHAEFYRPLSINILCESIAIFVFFKKNFNWPSRFIMTLSKYSFGAYLVHDMILTFSNHIGINAEMCNPIISIPARVIFVFVLSFAVSGILNHIPVLKKYIV